MPLRSSIQHITPFLAQCKMKILYISALIPQKILDDVLHKKKENYVVAPQKFHRNLVNGFVGNGHQIMILSYLPDCISYIPSFNEDGILYHFCKYTNKPGIKHLQIAKGIYCRINRLKKQGFVPDVLICDILNVSLCLGALCAGKWLKIRTAGIVTDLLGISEHEEKGWIQRVAAKISNSYITAFDYYIILTQQMNDVVNPHNRPYIVMEGLCDAKQLAVSRKGTLKKIFYAGGRPSKDGIDLLVPAFKRILDDNLQLNIYGNVPNVPIGPDPEDSRVVYHGLTDNKVIVAEECSSYLLVNPRPTGEEYTKYSFPSKVMEYMATGVPMVTTRLAGIPEEYYDYVFTFESCDVDTYYQTLMQILSLPENELIVKGQRAQDFVLKNKNNLAQTARIIELIKTK